MTWKWVGAVVNAVGIAAIGWGLAGLVDLGCDWHWSNGRTACGVPEGGGWYFAAFFVPPWLLVMPFKLDLYADDWRPTLGFPVGALVGCVAVFFVGTSAGFWILALALLAAGTAAPWATRRHSIASQRRARRRRSS